jgi:osmotically-inducible protein OsmY
MPPDTPAPEDEGQGTTAEQVPSSAELAEQIQHELDIEPLLKTSKLKVAVDDHSVTLTGTVDNEKEREIALSVAALHAGKREIIDHIKVRA